MGNLDVCDLSLDIPARHLLKGVTFHAAPGDCIAIMGPSGSGKTSLLNCLSGVTPSTSGSVCVNGVELSRLDASARAAFRLKHMGLVFQFGELLPELTVIENVSLPLRLLGVDRATAERRAVEWLARVGIADRSTGHPDTLAGGELQRAGIARALSHAPSLILADEPTGALDEANARSIASLLIDTAKASKAVLVVATHDPVVAQQADRILQLREGRVRPVLAPGRNGDQTGPDNLQDGMTPSTATVQR